METQKQINYPIYAIFNKISVSTPHNTPYNTAVDQLIFMDPAVLIIQDGAKNATAHLIKAIQPRRVTTTLQSATHIL